MTEETRALLGRLLLTDYGPPEGVLLMLDGENQIGVEDRVGSKRLILMLDSGELMENAELDEDTASLIEKAAQDIADWVRSEGYDIDKDSSSGFFE
jgi:hypothetical protein